MTWFARDDYGTPIPALKPSTVQTVSIGASSTATTSAVGSTTRIVRVVADVACYIQVASSPTASTSTTYLPANVIEYLRVKEGTDKVAVMHDANTGTLNVTEMV
ncbi:MAG: hypothetical protein VW498_02035 [Candidatus Thalassarchaeaceae archaeon]